MKRHLIVLGLLLYFIQAFPQDRFGVVVRCGGQGDFFSAANSGATFGVSGSGVLHVGIIDISLGVGYSYKLCSNDELRITDMSHPDETFTISHRMQFLNVPLAIGIQCWQHDKFRLKIFNELEYNRLFHYSRFLKIEPRYAITETWGDIPREARNGLTYRLGLSACYSFSEHCTLNVTPFFGVKAIRNEYEPVPTHFPSGQHGYLPDHLFSSGITVGLEYVF